METLISEANDRVQGMRTASEATAYMLTLTPSILAGIADLNGAEWETRSGAKASKSVMARRIVATLGLR